MQSQSVQMSAVKRVCDSLLTCSSSSSLLSMSVGSVWVNSHSVSDPCLPVCGHKDSGTCTDGGQEVSFSSLSHSLRHQRHSLTNHDADEFMFIGHVTSLCFLTGSVPVSTPALFFSSSSSLLSCLHGLLKVWNSNNTSSHSWWCRCCQVGL